MSKMSCCTEFWSSWTKELNIAMLSISHGSYISVNGITCPKLLHCTLFWLLQSNKWNGVIDNTLGIMWHWHWHHWHYIAKKVMLHIFQSSWPYEYNGVIDNAIGITWCWCQYLSVKLKKSCCISFWSSWANKCNVGIDDNTISIMWY